ncbi:MAG: methyltransferase domain-containing protein [Chloroflexota bacterium]|nr:MAG: methyltransferase domain-containing protein [Chloroflexota bacterium]
MIQENLLIVTAHPEFLDAGLAEIRRFDKGLTSVELLAPGIALCAAPDIPTLMRLAAEQHPIFVRHIAPVQAIVPLSNTEQDIGKLALAMVSLPSFERLERGQRFSVQTRIIQNEESSDKRPYTSGHLNQVLAEAIAGETGAVESIKKPQIVVSLLCTATKGYLGISLARENLSDWPGGARHFAKTTDQISRAEFKLLEALEVFGVTLPTKGRALDLGAAPGGWTRLLLEAGLHVVAVDPANLDPRLATQPRLEHYHGYAEHYLEEAIKTHGSFDLIVNDMRMDARDAARLLGQASRCLRNDGFVISVFKLPHATREIDPLATLRAALALLDKYYGIVQVRQLFHNRQEVTVLTARPLPTRA